MRHITSADAENNFGELIDLARAAPVAVTKYDQPVVVMMEVEEYGRLTGTSQDHIRPDGPKKRGK